MAQQHFGPELENNREMVVARGGDAELEAWQLMRWLSRQLTARREEPVLAQELMRFASAAHRSYAMRFSSRCAPACVLACEWGYVRMLLRHMVLGWEIQVGKEEG